MKILDALVLSLLVLSACQTDVTDLAEVTDLVEDSSTEAGEENLPMAFLYQYVGGFENGIGENGVTLGLCSDGVTVESYDEDAATWEVSKSATDILGDPVFSRLSSGNWAMTAWTGPADTRGAGYILYHESACPFVDEEDVIAIGPSSAKGCSKVQSINGAKTSQVFEAEDGNYVFHMIGGKIYLAHLSDASNSATDLDSLCILDSDVEALSEIDYGDSALVLNNDDLLLSDTAMGRRADGTWVLFVKGIEKNNGCNPNTICELCARTIYRATSIDLIHWSELEKVIGQASVPEATTTASGVVWLYWQDFTNVCTEEDQSLGQIAPVSAAYEMADADYELSEPMQVSFPDEAFETDSKIHYATNANPVMLPNEEALAAYEACME